MTAPESPPDGSRPDPAPGGRKARDRAERDRRLAEALRANLAKRKAQRRARDDGGSGGGGSALEERTRPR